MKRLAACLVTLLSNYTFGQGTVDVAKGLQPFAVYGGGSIDHVNLTNGNLYLNIPLLSFPQRGKDLRLNFDIRYNDKQWKISYTGAMQGSSPAGSWAFDNGSGDIGVDVTRDQFLVIGDSDEAMYSYQNTSNNNPTTDYVNVASWFVVTPDGARHYYGDTVTGNVDLQNVNNLQPTTDESGYYPISVNGPFIGRDGVRYSSSVIQDANGNQIKTTSSGWLDSVGRTIPGNNTGPGTGPTHFWADLLPGLQGSTANCQAGTTAARVWTVPAVGGSATYYLCYSNFNYQTAFNAKNLSGSAYILFADVNEVNGTAQLLSQIVLPNAKSYTFSYDSYLSLKRLGLPTGGSISYTWQNLALTWNGGSPTYAPISRGLATRSVDANDGTGPKTWHYQWIANPAGGWKHIITDPAGNDQVETISGESLLDGQTDLYQGCSPGNTLYCSGSGTLLKSVSRNNFIQMGGILDYGATSPSYSYVPGTTTTTIPVAGTGQSLVSQVVDTYLPASATVNSYDITNEGYIKGENLPPLYMPSNIGYNQRRSRTYYDYGTGAAGAPLRTETTSYFYEDHPQYGNSFNGGSGPFSNLLDLPEKVVTTDGAGAFASETDYSYDAGGCSTASSGVTTQHVAPPDAACGNLTTLTKVLAGGTNPVTKTSWYDTGEPASTTDPRSNSTTFSYGQCAGSVRTQTTDALNHFVTGGYDCNTGLLSSFTDENNQPTTYTYDNMGRLTSAAFPDGGGTTKTYNDTPPVSITTNTAITSTLTKTVVTVGDGLARVVQTQLTSDPETTDYTDISYDRMGRVYTRSNPHRSSSSTTDGATIFAYDALGRTTQVKEPDGSETDSSYSGNCTTSTDEAGNPRKSCSDALGRLTEVDEPGVGGAPETSGSGTVSISGSEQSTPSTGSTSTVSLNFSTYLYLGASITVVVNGSTAGSASVPKSGSGCQVAQTLASAINSNSNSLVTASYSCSNNYGTVQLSSKLKGSQSNYPVSIQCQGICSYVSYTTPMSGGMDTLDSGTVSVTVNGTTETASYGAGWNAQQVTDTIFAAFQSDASIKVSENGTTLNFTALDAGADSNYAVSTSVTWNSAFADPSFTACLQGVSCSSGTSSGTLTGGTDSTLGSQPLVTVYTYDALDNLTCAVQKGTDTTAFTSCASAAATWRPRSFAYDSLARLTSATNPESGTITYSYDANGNLTSKVSAKPNPGVSGTINTNYLYDALNRLTKKSYVNINTATALYGYDGAALSGCGISLPSLPNAVNLIGRRSAACKGDSSSVYSYDVMGRPSEKRANKGSVYKGYSMLYTYFKDGSVNTITYPSGDVVTYSVSGAGRVTQVSDSTNTFVGAPTSGVMYTPAGLLASMAQGSGITVGNTYNNRLQPSLLSAGSNSGGIMSLSYGFHAGHGDNGNVFQVSDNLDPTRNAVFQYDALNRLQQANTVATTGANCWGEVYTIDAWGNLTNRSGPAGMTGCSTGGLSQTADSKNRLTGWTYDAAGNVVNDGNGNMPTYNAENQMETDQGFTYHYDADGRRSVKSSTAGGTMYWPDPSDNVLTETDLSGNINEEYVYFNGERIARVDRPSGTVHYYFSDHLASSSVITDASGNVQQRYYYYPYGGTVAEIGGDSNHYLFTGKERDTESGLDYFGARYYSSAIGRFMSPDWSAKPQPIPYADLNDPQSLNLYTYVENNPLMRVDPNGHCDMDGEHHNWVWCLGHSLGITQTKKEQANEFRQDFSQFAIYKNGQRVDLNKASDEDVLAIRDELARQAAQNALARWNLAAPTIPGYPYVEKPNVTNSELQEIVDKLYQPSDVVPGGTAGAVRYEQITGELLSPAGHAQKAQDIANELNTFLKHNPGISANDQAAAKELIRDLENAVAGK